MPETDFKEQGKRNRTKGALFETKVRNDLEEKGWIVTKWMNTVDFLKDKVVPAKRKFNPFTKVMTIGTGFPDFLAYKKNEELFEVMGIEVKSNGSLDKFEKGQAIWYLEKAIIPKILIAKKKKEGRKTKIDYVDFREKYMDKKNK